MYYASEPRSLEFWSRLQVRLATEHEALSRRFTERLTPLKVTVDTGEQALQLGPKIRNELVELELKLDKLRLLSIVLRSQLRTAIFEAGIHSYEDRLSYFRETVGFLSEHLCELPRRVPLEQDIQAFLTQYAGLRSAGTGETIIAERQRLRALAVNLPVIGAEDTAAYESTVRDLQAEIDVLESELQALKVNTMMVLSTPDESLADVVISFGVDMFEYPDEAEPEEGAAQGVEAEPDAQPESVSKPDAVDERG